MGREEWIGRTQDFKGSETILRDIVMVDWCHYTFIQTHRMYISTVELNVNFGC